MCAYPKVIRGIFEGEICTAKGNVSGGFSALKSRDHRYHLSLCRAQSDFDYTEEDFAEPEWDPKPKPDVLPRVPASQALDTHRQEHAAIEEVVECMSRNLIRLDTLVFAICYGNPLCSLDNGKLKAERNQLMKSSKLPTILDHLHTPPSYTGSRPEAALKTLDEWAWKHVAKLSRVELDQFATDSRKESEKCNNEVEDLTNLENLSFEAIRGKASAFTPRPLQFLTNISETKNHARTRIRENPNSVLEPSFLERLKELIANHAIFWIYDNLQLPIPMKAQRGDCHTVTNNRTAMTVVAIPDMVKHIFMEDNPSVAPIPKPAMILDTSATPPMAHNKPQGTSTPPKDSPTSPDHAPNNPPAATEVPSPPALNWDNFLDIDCYKRLAACNIHFIINTLFKTVPGLADLDICSAESLSAPLAHHVMPSGEDFKMLYLLRVV
ncbi:hypothetical protein RHS04_08862, partial [Rhizoctonia solani]